MAETDDPFGEDWPAGQSVPVQEDGSRCLWCRRPLGAAEGRTYPKMPTVCDSCTAVLVSAGREPLSTFIDRLDAPLLVVTGDGVVELANAKARALLGKPSETIEGRRGGEVIECVHASEPRGCGYTPDCAGCVLRRSIRHTHTTGEPLVGVHACQDIRTPGGIRKAWYELSTERVGELVLLRMRDLGVERET